ncbi:MAG: right-handed parallel beta-helix repeat-containing protein [Bacteroidales bacterium]|nr:right-handed parallel beta-helix repeat-containing protein [Bacteroidales bacterium]
MKKKKNLYSSIFILFIFTLISCNKNENKLVENKKPIYGLETINLWEPTDSAIFIDPNNTTDTLQDGTKLHPFSSFKLIKKWKLNGVYAIKRGTTLETDAIVVGADGITLASYGSGNVRPIIKSSTKDHAVSTNYEGSNNTTFRDLEVYAPNATSCVIFRTNSQNSKIINCKLHGAIWGLRALNGNMSRLYIYNTEIFDIQDDGMFIQNVNNIEISHCYVHKVNQKWKPPTTPEGDAPGDGIQLSLCEHWHVHHCYIDRSDTGNKFCFISNNPDQKDGIFEYNYLTGPDYDGFSIYMHDGDGMIVRYNKIMGPSFSPCYSHGTNIKFYYNEVIDVTGPFFADKSALVYNNLFYRSVKYDSIKPLAIMGGDITAKNNIFDLGSDKIYRFKISGNLIEDHNLFVYGDSTKGSWKGDPRYLDKINKNFRPAIGSIVIDKGIDLGFTEDFDGNNVPSGISPEIGPYEYTRK